MAENPIALNVTIQTKEVKYAVKNKTYVTARSLEASGDMNYESAAQMKISDDVENGYELDRAINDAIAEVKVQLGEYLNETTTSTDNRIKAAVKNNEAVVLAFKLPTNFNSAAADALGADIHEFVVGRACYAWYRQTNMKIADACNKDAEVSLDRAKRALYKRSRPEAPTYEEDGD
ncbi:MAG: hypothetical protein IKQ20_11910 [Bacteroidales bacterium]|nr:hypothetical protein [Bacteroidales bacterium]